MARQEPIRSEKDFADSPSGWSKRWAVEMAAADKEVEGWHSQADKIVRRFLAKGEKRDEHETRVNVFTSNVQTQRAMLYGKTPRAEVRRRFQDANDDRARVAGIILERLLNTDVEKGADGYTEALGLALEDKLLVGMGNARLRYEADFEEEEIPPKLGPAGEELAPGFTQEKKVREDVVTDYVYWKDQRWSPARTFSEIRWWAFRAYMTKDQIAERFDKEGKKHSEEVPYAQRSKEKEGLGADPWQRCEVWEIWSKEHGKVFWWVKGYEEVLDQIDDPLGLDGFWPFPKPLVANATSSQFIPRPDFLLAQDLYNEIDSVSSRITLLERAVKVAGVYDSSSDGVQRLLDDAAENVLVPVDNWALFAEKGGIKGQVDFMPLEEVVRSLDKLREYRGELIQLLFQVTGMSDILRGASQQGSTATEQAIKAKFASVRMQYEQDNFARFATDLLKLKAEIVAKHFDPETILARSNIMETPDAQLAQPAVELLKDELVRYKIEVKPENVSLTDYAALKGERVEFVQALTMMLQAAQPMIQQLPGSLPFMLEILKWVMAGFRGGATVEGVLDQALIGAKQMAAQPQQQQPDPKAEAAKIKAEADLKRVQAETQGEIQQAQATAQVDLQKNAMKAQQDLAKLAMELKLRGQAKVAEAVASPPLAPNGMRGG